MKKWEVSAPVSRATEVCKTQAGRLDILFSMCCTALWQNTADLSNDSETPHRRPRRRSAVLHLKLHPCMHVAAHFSGTCSNTRRSWRRRVIERKPQIRRITHIRDHLRVTSLSVPPPPLLSNLSPLHTEMICSSGLQSVGRLPACLTCGRRDRKKCLSLWETLAL